MFGILYFLALVYNLMQIGLVNPIELLRGGNVGEKEPKTKMLRAIIGAACMHPGNMTAKQSRFWTILIRLRIRESMEPGRIIIWQVWRGFLLLLYSAK